MKNRRKPNPSLNTSAIDYQQQLYLQSSKDESFAHIPATTICQRCTSPLNLRDLNQSLEQKQNQFCQNENGICNVARNKRASMDYNNRTSYNYNYEEEDELAQAKYQQRRNQNESLKSTQVMPNKSRSSTLGKEQLRKSVPINSNFQSVNHSKKLSLANQDFLKQEKTRKQSSLHNDKKIDLGVKMKVIDSIVEEKVKQREKRLIDKENTIIQMQEDFQRKVEELDSKLAKQFNSQQHDRSTNDNSYSRQQFGHSIPLSSVTYNTNTGNNGGQNLITSASSIDGKILSVATGQNESQFNVGNRTNTFVRNASEATTTFTTNNQNTSLYSQNGLSQDQLLMKNRSSNQYKYSTKNKDYEDNLQGRSRVKTCSQFGEDNQRGSLNNGINSSYINYDSINNYQNTNNIPLQYQDNCDEDLDDFSHLQDNHQNQLMNQSQLEYQQNEDLQNQYKFHNSTNISNLRIQNPNLVLENLSYSISNKNSNGSKVRSTSSYGGNGQLVTPNNYGQYLGKINTNSSFQNSGKIANDALNNTLSLNTTACMLNQTLNNHSNYPQQNFLNTTQLTVNDVFLDQKVNEKQRQLDFIEHDMRLKEKAIKEKKEQLQDLDRNIAEKKEFIRKYTDNYERLREDAHQVKMDLKDEEKLLEKVKEEKKKEIEQTKALRVEFSEYTEKIQIAKAELETIEINIKEKEVQLKEKNDKLQLSQLQLQQTESSVETQMIMIRQQTEQIEIRFKQLNDLSVYIDKERRKLQQKEADVENLNQNCIAAHEQNIIKEKQLQKREEELIRTEVYIDAERVEVEEVRQKLKEKETIINQDKKKIDEVSNQLKMQKQNVIQFKDSLERELKEKEENLFQREGSIKMKEDLLVQQGQIYEDMELKMQTLNFQGQMWEKKCQVDQENILQLQNKYAQGLSNSASATRKRKVTNSQSGDFSSNKENDLFLKTNTKTNIFPPSNLKLLPPSTTSTTNAGENNQNQSNQKPPLLFSNTKTDYSKQTVTKTDYLDIQNYSNTPKQRNNNEYDRGVEEGNESQYNKSNFNNSVLTKSNSSGGSSNKVMPCFKSFNKK